MSEAVLGYPTNRTPAPNNYVQLLQYLVPVRYKRDATAKQAHKQKLSPVTLEFPTLAAAALFALGLRGAICTRYVIMFNYTEHSRTFLSALKVSAATIQRYCPSMLPAALHTSLLRSHCPESTHRCRHNNMPRANVSGGSRHVPGVKVRRGASMVVLMALGVLVLVRVFRWSSY